MVKAPGRLSLVRFDAEAVPKGFRRKYPLRAGRAYVFLGEIPNMPGHCVVAEQDSGRIYAGDHAAHFVNSPMRRHEHATPII
jgi:hypothetical protein